MRLKFTIAICALLVLGLAVSQANAEGYRISSAVNTVVESGNNQVVGGIRLTHVDSGAVHLPENNKVTIKYGGLVITDKEFVEATSAGALTAADNAAGTLALSEDKKSIVLTITTHDGTFTIAGVRVDASAHAEDTLIASLESAASTDTGDYKEEPAAAGGTSGSIKVSNFEDGLMVTQVDHVGQLICDKTETLTPTITIEEGFKNAWETDGGNGLSDLDADGTAATGQESISDDTYIRVVVSNVPTGVTFRWPGQGNFAADGTTALSTDHGNYFRRPEHMIDHDNNSTTPDALAGSLYYSDAGTSLGDDKTKRWVVYQFVGTDPGGTDNTPDDVVSKFEISPRVEVDLKEAGSGGGATVAAQLWPMPKTGDADNRDSTLSYTHTLETEGDGSFLAVSECVTYLLFPFLTCGAQADWTTGIAVANTTRDDEAFPFSGGTEEQGGSVMIYAYPKSTTAEKMAAGEMMSSPETLGNVMMDTLSGNLASGDTVAVTCADRPMLAGFEGYAIVKAGFQAAHGMAFVLGNFQDGAAIDVAHGYIALVIPDPEYSGARGQVGGETLGH